VARKFFDNVRHAVATLGAGAIALSTVPAGWQSFVDAGAVDGDNPPYRLAEGDAWENGYLTLDDGATTATRNVTSSSNSGDPLDLGGSATLTCTLTADLLGDLTNDIADLAAALGDKAPLASPALTGTPTAPTASGGTNTTQIATTAFVRAEIAALLDSAPGTLDTLNELAAALGDDANFAATMTTALAGKQPLDASLTAFAVLTTAANKGLYFTGADTPATFDISASGRALANIAGTSGSFPYLSGTDAWSLGTITAAGRALLDDADAAAQRATLSAAGFGVNTFTDLQTIAVADEALALLAKSTNGGVRLRPLTAGGGSLEGVDPTGTGSFAPLWLVGTAVTVAPSLTPRMAFPSGGGMAVYVNSTFQGAINFASDSQASDAYVVTLSPAPTALVDGMEVKFRANTANTGAASLNVNGAGAKTIVKRLNTTLANGDIVAGGLYECLYDGTNDRFVLTNPVVN